MILIISENSDLTTNHIVGWLRKLKAKYTRINEDETVEIKNLQISNLGKIEFDIITDNIRVSYSQIKAVYYRRGRLKVHIDINEIHSKNSYLSYFITKELQVLTDFIHYALELKTSIGSYENRSLNKLKILNIASSFGLNIPNSYVINEKEELYSKVEKSLITKNLYETTIIFNEDRSEQVYSKTYRVDSALLNRTSGKFLYSLIQEEIKKEFEIRSFYVKGLFFSSAMFTQSNTKTIVDFRNYDSERPTRIIPFNLPKLIENKLSKLFREINLDTGSVDLIYYNKEYYFLEINPVGQYSMISVPCNYYIEKHIANILLDNEDKLLS